MLPVHSLDDQTFQEIVENAKKMIPNLTDEWINTSASDSGIAFIELFAWLKEMQQYYLNQITIKNKYKYLKLLGEEIISDTPSSAVITISNLEEEKILPDKCKFSANGIIFETLRKEILFPIYIEGFYTTDENEQVISSSIQNWKREYHVFGKTPKIENKFYIVLNEQIPKNKIIDITINIYDEYEVKRNEIIEDLFYPLAVFKWEYYCKDGWKEIEHIHDSTQCFLCNGKISFNINEDMKRKDDEYVIRAVLKECNYEVPPILKNIATNSIDVIQKETLSECIEFDVNEDEIQEFTLTNYLTQMGKIEVFIAVKDNTWEITNEYDLTITQNSTTLVFDKSKIKKFPIKGEKNIKVCCYDKDFEFKRNIDVLDGTPLKNVKLNIDNIYYDDFKILISKNRNSQVFEQWNQIEDLYLAKCNDKVYSLDIENDVLTFGDGINGKIPMGKIIIVSCSKTIANDGNVKSGEINDILWFKNDEKINNYEHATGGKKAPTIDEMFKISRKRLKKVTRAVTDEDYEIIVKSTPGLMINNVKAIVPEEQNNIFSNNNPNCIYIVAEPYTVNKKQGLNKAYIKNIKNQIEKYRLITTEVEVISPEYIGIDIQGEIIVKPYYKDAKERICEAINKYFEHEEWNFGVYLTYSDLYGIIDTLDCVNYIYSLSISFEGRGAKRNLAGDIEIPENGMIYLRNYDITVSDS